MADALPIGRAFVFLMGNYFILEKTSRKGLTLGGISGIIIVYTRIYGRASGVMVLTIDIGNTNIGIGGFLGDRLTFVAHLSTVCTKTADEYALSIRDVLKLHGIDKGDVCGVIVSSVVPPLNFAIKAAVKLFFSTEAIFVGPGIKTGIGIQCDIPSSVGADIIASAVAVHEHHACPALIIDMGTATKMTVLNNRGAFIGTSIIPGVMMGLDALSECTAQLPRISLDMPSSIIAKNTVDCMRSGVLFGNASMIDGMIDRITEETGEELNIYMTGGMANVIAPLCKHRMLIDEDLVLKGLNTIYQKNKS